MVPLKTIRIKNFQSVAEAEIPLGNLTVLVGQGDAGKSAILRALRALMLNEASDDDIRHGEKRCTVDLFFEDGVNITWWREKRKGGCYGFHSEGEYTEYLKTGGDVPEAIAEYLGIGRIEVDKTTELTPQLSDQHDTPFILWETGSRRARIIGKATKLDTVVSAQMACKKEHDREQRAVNDATDRLTEITGQLKGLPDYEAIEKDIDTAGADLTMLRDNLGVARRAWELADEIEGLRSQVAAVDVSRFYTVLDECSEKLGVSERAYALGKELPELQKEYDGQKELLEDTREAIAAFEQQLADACAEAGVCMGCGGLLDHTECAP